MLKDNLQAFNMESKKMVNTEQFESVCRVQVPSDKPVKKVMSIHAQPMIISSEKTGDNLSFSGSTNYQIVYQTEGDKLTSVTVESSWQNSLAVINTGEYFLNVQAKENTVTDNSAVEIVLSTLLNVDLYMIISDTVNVISGLSEDYVTKENTYSFNKVVNKVKEDFTEVSEQEVNYMVDEVLYNNVDVRLTNLEAGIDTVTFEGQACVTTYLLSQDKVVSIDKVVEFKQEVSAVSVVPDNIVNANAFLNKIKVTASVSDIDKKSNIIYTLDIGLNAVIYTMETITLIEDAFSIKKETITNSECLLKETFLGQTNIETTLVSNFEADRNFVDVLYFAGAESTITDKKVVDEKCLVSGAIGLNFICLDEAREPVAIKGYIPFSQEIEASVSDKTTMQARLLSYRMLNSRDIEVNFKLNFVNEQVKEEYVTFINSIEETEDREVVDEAISVYVVNEKETLFGVAKNLCIKPEDILAQNELSTEELSEGTRIIVYQPLNINF